MILFDGEYKWDGKKEDDHKPVSWWPGSYRLKIVDVSKARPDIHTLKPYIVFSGQTMDGFTVAGRYQDLVKSVCKKFDLELEKLLWISYKTKGDGKLKVAVFKNINRISPDVLLFYVEWRPLLENEYKEIEAYLPDGVTVKKNSA